MSRPLPLAFLVALCLAGCEPDDMGKQIPPWLLWGGTQNLKVVSTGAGTQAPIAQGQIARIDYDRPDTWKWFFLARIVEGTTAAANTTVTCVFDVTMGVGRTQTTARLGRFVFNWAGAVPVSQDAIVKFANNRSTGNPQDDGAAAVQNVVDSFPAQNIQVVATVQLLNLNAGDFVTMEMTALFAPTTHVPGLWFPPEEFKPPRFRSPVGESVHGEEDPYR